MIISRVKFDFEYVDPCLCYAWVATAVIGAGVLGAGATIYGANKAADTQSANAKLVADMQQQQYQQTRSDLSPYRAAGTTATDQLTGRLSELTSPIVMDQAALEKTPGYQFNLTQGLKAVTNSSAARGLGTSGAALKGAASFATGLADSTYQNQFNNANTNQSNAYNRLKGLIDTGENASAQTGVLGEKAAYNSGVALTGGANAQAAADNATGKALSGLASNIGGYAMSKGLYGSNSGSGNSSGVSAFNSGNPIY